MRHPCRDWIAGVCPGEAQPGCRADRCGEQNGDRQGRPCLNTGSPAAITTMAQFGEHLLRQQQQPSQVLRILELAEPAGVLFRHSPIVARHSAVQFPDRGDGGRVGRGPVLGDHQSRVGQLGNLRGGAAARAVEEEQQGLTEGVSHDEVCKGPNGLRRTSACDHAGGELQDLKPASVN